MAELLFGEQPTAGKCAAAHLLLATNRQYFKQSGRLPPKYQPRRAEDVQAVKNEEARAQQARGCRGPPPVPKRRTPFPAATTLLRQPPAFCDSTAVRSAYQKLFLLRASRPPHKCGARVQACQLSVVSSRLRV